MIVDVLWLGVPIWCGVFSLLSLATLMRWPHRAWLGAALLGVVALHTYALVVVPAGWSYIMWRWLPMTIEALQSLQWGRALLCLVLGVPAFATLWSVVALCRYARVTHKRIAPGAASSW